MMMTQSFFIYQRNKRNKEIYLRAASIIAKNASAESKSICFSFKKIVGVPGSSRF
jgi:uncharacterized protein YqgQ